ncbi:DUF3638 family protein [Tetrahymena thermophila SB210]|uniref:ubiquitinyl hydrolase 1 n=1 Tax=Tetrahymena thermophila (strain SB210) TaxID=312017 RepID=A0A1B9C253_TETTS|nr:DUF3638 family protein [Tetrahymena thermophila SB210]
MRNQLVNQSLETFLKNNFEKLENMFSSACQTQLKDNALEELFPVNLLLSYFQSRQYQINYQQVNIFQLSDENQNLFQNLVGLFTQWKLSLEEIKKVQYEESLEQYILKLRSQIQNSDQLILPTGFSSIHIKKQNVAHIKMLDDKYQGFYPSCIIIENNVTNKSKNLRIIDPITPYQSSINQINIDKINLGICIDDVALDSLSQVFLQQLLSIRIFQTLSPYLYEEFYEVVIPQLEGNSYIKQNESDFLKLDEKRFQNLSYTLVKKVLYYFIQQKLEEKKAFKLYNQIVLEFEFKVLISLFQLYSEKESFTNQYYDNKYPCILVIENILVSLCERVSQEATLQDDIDKNLLIEKTQEIQFEILKRQESRFLVQKISNIKFNQENFAQYLSKELKDLKMYKDLIHIYSYGQGNYLPTALRNKEIANHFLTQNQDILQNFIQFSKVLDNLSSQSVSIKTTIQILQLIENFVFLFSELGFKDWCDKIDFQQNNHFIDRQKIYSILLKASQVYYSCSAIKYQKFFDSNKSEYDPNHFTKFVLTMFSLYAIFQELIKTDESINLDANNFTGSTKFSQSASLNDVLPKLSIPDQKWLQLLHQVQFYFKAESEFKQPILDQYNNQFNDFESKEVKFYIELILNQNQQVCLALEELLNDITHNQQHKLYQMVYTLFYLPKSFQQYRDITFYARISLFYFKQIPRMYQYNCLSLSYSKYEIQLGGQTFSKFNSYEKKRYTDFYLSENEEKYQQIILPVNENFQYKTENQVIGQQNEKPEQYTRKQFYSQQFIQLNDNLKYIYLLTAIQDQQIQLDKIEENILVKQIIHKERISYSKDIQLNRLKDDDKLSVKLISQLCKIGCDLNEKQSFCKLLFNLIEILNFLYNFVSQNAQKILRDFLESIRQQIIQKKEDNKIDDFEFQSIQSAVCILTYQINNHLNSEDQKNILDFRIQIENSFRMNKPLPYSIYYRIMEFILSEQCFFEEISQNQLMILKNYIIKKQNRHVWQFYQQYNIYQQKQYTFNPIQGRILNNGFPISGLPNFIISSEIFQTFYKNVTILFEYKKSKFLGYELPSYKSINYKKGKIKIILLNSSNFIIQEKLEGLQEYETLITQNYMNDLPVYIKSKFNFNQLEQISHDFWYLKNKILVKNRERQLQYEIDLEQNEIYSNNEQLYLIPFTQKFVAESCFYRLFERFESTAYIYSNKTCQTKSNPKQIMFYRLGISFLYQNENLLSNDYKDYQISREQTLQTLQGLQNYLILEKSQNFMDCKESLKKVIISHHPIIKTVDYKIKTDLNMLKYPSYFTYDVNEELGLLSSQTVSGNIYLALLYYKEGDIIQDKLTCLLSESEELKLIEYYEQYFSKLELAPLNYQKLLINSNDISFNSNTALDYKTNINQFNKKSSNLESEMKQFLKSSYSNFNDVSIQLGKLISNWKDSEFSISLFYKIYQNIVFDQDYNKEQYQYLLQFWFLKNKDSHHMYNILIKILQSAIQYPNQFKQIEKPQHFGFNRSFQLNDYSFFTRDIPFISFRSVERYQVYQIRDKIQNLVSQKYLDSNFQPLVTCNYLYEYKTQLELKNSIERIFEIQNAVAHQNPYYDIIDTLVQKRRNYEVNQFFQELSKTFDKFSFIPAIISLTNIQNIKYQNPNSQILKIQINGIKLNYNDEISLLENTWSCDNLNQQEILSGMIKFVQKSVEQKQNIQFIFDQLEINEQNLTNYIIKCGYGSNFIHELRQSYQLYSQKPREHYDLVEDKNIEDLKECFNITNYPEWLLFEFQNNILIREQQKELTLSLFNDNVNSIYQLNMGEGKTSVILMLLCQMIPDRKNIIRINCIESLYGIMQDILRNKFSGMFRKKIYLLPFSRDIDFTEENIQKLEKILSDIRDQKGVLLMTPEQRQCFQLKNQEILLEYLETKDADNVFDWRQHHFITNESHTRGSDFVLPITSIGILTVGKDMNKDKFMQAAMRLRDLDFKQSVVVWGSEEISSRIAKLNNINLDEIKTKHVIIWVTYNTIIKNEKDLYPVTLLKFKEQIKSNSLQIQKRHLSTPIKSLIFYLENHVHDEIEILYQHSPQLKSTLSIIQEKSQKFINDFVSHIQNDQLDHQLLNYIQAQIKNLNFNDIISKIKGKLPDQIMTYDVNFDCDEENEQEVEEIQQQEQVVKTKTANAQTEKLWDFNLIFENNFIKNCLTYQKQYPNLFSIKDHFQRSSFKDLMQIKWNENIYVTQNFMKTVNEVDYYQTYQNDYFRPIGMFLIHNISQPKIILLSGFEADFIIKILEQKKQEFVCMMHIDDLENDPLITPRSINLVQTENLKNLFMILKLINGQCYFKNDELINLKKCLGLIQEDGLDSDIEKSNKIYDILKQAQLVQNCQFTTQLLEMMNDNNKSDIIQQIEKQFNINLFELLRNILKNSIFDESTKSIDLLKIFSCLAAIRGKANQFVQSTLKNMIQIKFEWHI